MGLHEIRQILHHILFQTNITECFTYEKTCSGETTRGTRRKIPKTFAEVHKMFFETLKMICKIQNKFREIHKISQDAQKLFCEIEKTLPMKYAKCSLKCAKPFHLRSQVCDIFSNTPLYSNFTGYRTEPREWLRTESIKQADPRWIATVSVCWCEQWP